MEERKERYEKSQQEVIETIPEIAAKLKETSMVRGKFFCFIIPLNSAQRKDPRPPEQPLQQEEKVGECGL